MDNFKPRFINIENERESKKIRATLSLDEDIMDFVEIIGAAKNISILKEKSELSLTKEEKNNLKADSKKDVLSDSINKSQLINELLEILFSNENLPIYNINGNEHTILDLKRIFMNSIGTALVVNIAKNNKDVIDHIIEETSNSINSNEIDNSDESVLNYIESSMAYNGLNESIEDIFKDLDPKEASLQVIFKKQGGILKIQEYFIKYIQQNIFTD